MTLHADTRVSPRLLLILAGLLVAVLLVLVPAVSPETAVAQTGCSPNGDDTFTPGGDPGEPPPGGVVVDPGDPCPETEPVEPAQPEPLPPAPRCDPCKDPQEDEDTESVSSQAAPPPSVQSLPFTGIDREKIVLMLSGVGLLTIGLGLGIRRRAYRP